MHRLIIALLAVLFSGSALAAESLDDWGPWAIDSEQPPLGGYDVTAYSNGVEQEIPMANDLENSFQPVGQVESALSDVGGTLNDQLEILLDANPGQGVNDVLDDALDLLNGL